MSHELCDVTYVTKVKSDSANSRGMLTHVARHKWWHVGLMRCRALLRDYRALWWQCRAPLWRYMTLSRQCRAVLRRRTQTEVARHKWNEIYKGSIHVHIPRLWFVNMPSNINAHIRRRIWTHPHARGMKQGPHTKTKRDTPHQIGTRTKTNQDRHFAQWLWTFELPSILVPRLATQATCALNVLLSYIYIFLGQGKFRIYMYLSSSQEQGFPAL